MAHQINLFDDKDWAEVMKINSFALFMGYLLIGVRGLGLLVLTWTTVVLLGGFVSMLQKEDFWCLTAITLVQTAGVFDFLLKEKASDLGNSLMGLLAAVSAAFVKPFKKGTNTSANSSKINEDKEPSKARIVFVVVLAVVQVLVFGIVLCPLAVLYVLGLYLSSGISLWRLIQHNYGNPDGDTNLRPALNVLYTLAVAQGVVYGYRAIYDKAARTALVQGVADRYSLETDLVSEYLEETVEGCMKDPSFARGRNLVTYAVELLIESKSRYNYMSGVLILGTLVEWSSIVHKDWMLEWSALHMGPMKERKDLMKDLLTGSASFSHAVQRLLETFGPRSPYSTEIRVRAATIVASVANSICLNELSHGMMIECISSLLDTFDDYTWQPEGCVRDWLYERYWLLDKDGQWYSRGVVAIPIPRATSAESKTQESDSDKLRLQGYKGLVVQGLRILQGLAVSEENCRVISKTEDLLSKTMALLVSDQLRRDHHDEWSFIAEESLEFINRLLATLGGTDTTKLRSEILSNSQATIFRTLECHKCNVMLKRHAAQVLLQLSPETPPYIVPGGSSSKILAWILLHIVLVPDYHYNSMCGSIHLAKKSSDIARLAGEKMHAMVSSKAEASDTSMPSVVGDVIGSLARTVAGAENSAYRIHAATILRHLCRYYIKDDENLKELKKSVASVMEEVLRTIVHYWTTTEEIHAATEANSGGNVLLAEGLDLEQGGVPLPHEDNGEESGTTHLQQKGEQHPGIQLQQALIVLCWWICIKWIDLDKDLTGQFNEIAAKICSGQGMPDKTFRTLVDEAMYKLREEMRASRLLAVPTS